MEDLRIRPNKWKTIGFIIFGILAVIGCIDILQNSIVNYNVERGDEVFFERLPKPILICVAIVGIIFFGFGVVCFVYLLLKKNFYSFVISDDGFTQNSIKGNSIFVAWKDVKKISEEKLHIMPLISQKFIGIELNNTEQFLSNLTKMQRKSIRLSLSMGFSHIQIPLVGTNFKIDEIITEMNKRMENAKNK